MELCESKINDICYHNTNIKLLGSLDDLMDEMKKSSKLFEQDKLIYNVISLLDGINLFHQRETVHKNVKASNVLIKNGSYKISNSIIFQYFINYFSLC